MIELSRYFSIPQLVVNGDMNILQMPVWKLDSRIQHKPIAINTMKYYDAIMTAASQALVQSTKCPQTPVFGSNAES